MADISLTYYSDFLNHPPESRESFPFEPSARAYNFYYAFVSLHVYFLGMPVRKESLESRAGVRMPNISVGSDQSMRQCRIGLGPLLMCALAFGHYFQEKGNTFIKAGYLQRKFDFNPANLHNI